MTFVVSAFVVTWIALLLLGLALSGVIRQVRQLSTQGGVAGTLSVRSPLKIDLGDTGISAPAVIMLVDNSCHACAKRLVEMNQLAGSHRDDGLTFVVATRDRLHQTVDEAVVRVHERANDIFSAVAPRMLPYGLVVDGSGNAVGGGAIGSKERLEQLLALGLEHTTIGGTRESKAT